MALEFFPHCSPQAGRYVFDVTQTKQGGSAGSVTLILQTILLPLALAQGTSRVTLKGGTHVAWSPPVTYIEQVYLPILARLGVQAGLELRAWGWYPCGGGEVHVQIAGGNALRSLQLLERGNLQQVRGLAVVTELPSHIPQRMASRADNLLREAHLKAQVQPLRERGVAPGAGIFLTADYEFSLAGFSALGRQGVPAEAVAQRAVQDLLAFHQGRAPVDAFLGDQLLLPLALGQEPSQYRVDRITKHLKTNAWTLAQFGIAQVTIDEETQTVRVVPLAAN
jgi:RNA 3'-terminal phosphate cyclase (ATP)